jgi:hypothetical protein
VERPRPPGDCYPAKSVERDSAEIALVYYHPDNPLLSLAPRARANPRTRALFPRFSGKYRN